MAPSNLQTARRSVLVGAILAAIYLAHMVTVFQAAVDVGPTGGLREHLGSILSSCATHAAIASLCWWFFVVRRVASRWSWMTGAAVAAGIAPALTLAYMSATNTGMVWFPDGFVLSRKHVLSPGFLISVVNAVIGGFLARRGGAETLPYDPRPGTSGVVGHQGAR